MLFNNISKGYEKQLEILRQNKKVGSCANLLEIITAERRGLETAHAHATRISCRCRFFVIRNF
jgi:hypothetical protein